MRRTLTSLSLSVLEIAAFASEVKTMNYEVTNENYLPIVKETERLIYELAMIVEELRITSQASEDITSKHEQLRDVSKMVASWKTRIRRFSMSRE